MIKTALGLDTRELKQGKREFDATFADMANTAKSSFAGIAGALGIGFSAAGAVQYLRETANELDAIGKAARRAGVNTTDYQVLSEAFKMGAGSAEELTMSLTRLQNLMGMAGRGDERAMSIFSRMHLDVDRLKKLAPDQLMQTIARSIRQIPDANDRATTAVEIFGEKGLKVLDILADGLDNLKREMESSGRLFDEDSIKSAEAFNDSVTKLDRSVKALAASLGAIKAMDWIAGVAEGTSRLPGLLKQAQKEGATGIWAGGTAQALAFAADYFTFGQASQWAGKIGDGSKPVFSTGPGPGEPNLVEQHMRNMADPDFIRRKREREEEERDRRAAEYARKKDAATAISDRLINSAGFQGSAATKAAKDELEVTKMLAEIYKQILRTGYQLTDQDKKTIENKLRLTIQMRRAAEEQKKFTDALKGSLGPMRESLMASLGNQRQAEIEKALRELEKAKGSKLDETETAQATRLGQLRAQLALLGINRQPLDTEIGTNDLASLGGWYESVTMPDSGAVNDQILSEAQAMRQILNDIEILMHEVGRVK